MVSERPTAIHREQVGPRGWGSHRLHNESGPALAFDGWAIYAIHGVRVPAYVVENPEQITIAAINAETNAEVRRVMLERFGFDRYIAESGAKAISRDEYGELYDLGGIRRVKVINSTPEPDGTKKAYVLGASMRAESARQAVAATFGLSAEDYSPVVET
jgi:hypothetical protein